MDKRKTIIFDLMMTNQCNRRCEYCCIDFNNGNIPKEKLDRLYDLIRKDSNDIDNYLINFFGGEPLLRFDSITYLTERLPKDKVSFSIGTNGTLLNQEMMEFFKAYGFHIFLTINDKNIDLLEKKPFIKDYLHLMEINYVVSPNNIYECIRLGLLEKLIGYGFKKINIIPVFVTMKWDIESLKLLKGLVESADSYIQRYLDSDLMICKFSYFDGIPECPLFVIDVDGNIYQDLSDELYIGKQFKNLSTRLKDEIENDTFLGNISDIGSIENILERYSMKKILKLIHEIPKDLGHLYNNMLLYRIMNEKPNYRIGKGYDIFTNDLKLNGSIYDK